MKILPFFFKKERQQPKVLVQNPQSGKEIAEIQKKAARRVLRDFPIFEAACPLASQVGETPVDCTFDGTRCRGCATLRHVINTEIETATFLAKNTGENRYITLAKVFRSLYKVFDSGVSKKSLE